MNQPGVFKLAGGGPTRPDEPLAQPAPQGDVLPAASRTTAAQAAAVAAKGPAAFSAFVPTVLMALALAGWFAAQLWDAYQQRQNLLAAHVSQQQTVDNAGKLRQSLDALAADTQRMADGGNGNAALLVAELRKRGITISVPGAAAPAAPAAPVQAPAPTAPAQPRP